MRDRTSDRLVQEPRIKRIVRHRPRGDAEPDHRPPEDRDVAPSRGPVGDRRPED
ncbi:hypothetical protein [Actinomycetospora flava]|uniref:Uncharacterized protein n=1 Tax=Actinomycetospora flava TaxID=3129232 RepID=A0ABU8M3Q0_9PSEU